MLRNFADPTTAAAMADHVANLKAAIYANLNGLDGQILQFEVKANPVAKKSECWRKFGHVHALHGGLVQVEDTSFVACFACHTVYTFKSKNGTSTIMGHKCLHDRVGGSSGDNKHDGGKKDGGSLHAIRKPKNPELDTLKRDITKALLEDDMEKGFTLHSNPVATKSDCWKRFGHVYQHGAPFEAFESTYVACFNCKVVYQYKVRNGTSTMTTHACATTPTSSSSSFAFGGIHALESCSDSRRPHQLKRAAPDYLNYTTNPSPHLPQRSNKRHHVQGSSNSAVDMMGTPTTLQVLHSATNPHLPHQVLPPKKALDVLKQSITASLVAASSNPALSSPYDLRPNAGESKAECWNRFGFVYKHNALVVESGSHFVGCYDCKVVYTFKSKNGTSSLLSHVCAMRKAHDRAKEALVQDLLHLCTHDVLPIDVFTGAGFRRLCSNLMQVGKRHPTLDKWEPDAPAVQDELIKRFQVGKAALRERVTLVVQQDGVHVGVSYTQWPSVKQVQHQTMHVALTIHFIDADFVLHNRLLDVHEITNATSEHQRGAVDGDTRSDDDVLLPAVEGLTELSLADIGRPVAVLTGMATRTAPNDDIGAKKGALYAYQTFASVELDAVLYDVLQLDPHTPWTGHTADPVVGVVTHLMLQHADVSSITWHTLVRALDVLRSQWALRHDLWPAWFSIQSADASHDPTDDLVAFCTPFVTAADAFQKESMPTLHTVCYWRHALCHHCRRLPDGQETVHAVVGAVKAAALRRLEQWTLCPTHIMAALLDPGQRKRLGKFGVSPDEIAAAKEALRHRLVELVPRVKAASASAKKSDKAKASGILSMYGGESEDEGGACVDDTTSLHQPGVTEEVEAEMTRYFDTALIEESITATTDGNPLVWWKWQAKRWPLLSRAARSVLCLPAAPTTPDVVKKRRHYLSANVRELLFVQSNQDLIAATSSSSTSPSLSLTQLVSMHHDLRVEHPSKTLACAARMHLLSTVELESQCDQIQHECAVLAEENESVDAELRHLKQEIKQKQNTISTYELMLLTRQHQTMPPSQGSTLPTTSPSGPVECILCNKRFLSTEYLLKHQRNKHVHAAAEAQSTKPPLIVQVEAKEPVESPPPPTPQPTDLTVVNALISANTAVLTKQIEAIQVQLAHDKTERAQETQLLTHQHQSFAEKMVEHLARMQEALKDMHVQSQAQREEWAHFAQDLMQKTTEKMAKTATHIGPILNDGAEEQWRREILQELKTQKEEEKQRRLELEAERKRWTEREAELQAKLNDQQQLPTLTQLVAMEAHRYGIDYGLASSPRATTQEDRSVMRTSQIIQTDRDVRDSQQQTDDVPVKSASAAAPQQTPTPIAQPKAVATSVEANPVTPTEPLLPPQSIAPPTVAAVSEQVLLLPSPVLPPPEQLPVDMPARLDLHRAATTVQRVAAGFVTRKQLGTPENWVLRYGSDIHIDVTRHMTANALRRIVADKLGGIDPQRVL
ncbi:hypothetical protein DYB32_008863, partial [Aphanomyces invadans]